MLRVRLRATADIFSRTRLIVSKGEIHEAVIEPRGHFFIVTKAKRFLTCRFPLGWEFVPLQFIEDCSHEITLLQTLQGRGKAPTQH